MSRFYDIQLFDKQGGQLVRQWTSLYKGVPDPAALQVELDIPVTEFAVPVGSASVTIWGIPLADVAQGSNFNGNFVSIYGGMSKGLPLANPTQQGLLVQGTVLQAFGNWVGNVMTLTLIVLNAPPADVPQNIVFNWAKGTTLANAITNTLAVAFPGFKVNIQIDPNLVLNQAVEVGYYQTISQFAKYLKNMSASLIVGGTYNGVRISLTETTFNVYDGTTATTPLQINFTDLIGQPTWIDPGTMQFNTILRADISVGTYVHMPSIPVITTPQSQSQARTKSAFGSDGRQVFQVNFIRHVGNSRGSGGESWITTFNANPAGSVS